tara:strand:- start:230 stop:1366 length:1137 start_codon:yes stop_codon:yes gene_type:complete
MRLVKPDYSKVPEGADATDLEKQNKEIPGIESGSNGMIGLEELMKRSEGKHEFTIEPILPKSGITVLAGTEGSGKSILCSQLALCIVTGQSFLEFVMGARRKVMIFNFELTDEEYARRVRLQYQKMAEDINKVDTSLFFYKTYDGGAFSERWDSIENYCRLKDSRGAVVIVDNMYTSTERNLSDNSELRPVLKRIREISDEFGICFVLVGHHNKNTVPEPININHIQGGKQLTMNADSVIQIAANVNDETVKCLKWTKSRYSGSSLHNKPLKLTLDDNLLYTRRGIIKSEIAYFTNMAEKIEIQALRSYVDIRLPEGSEFYTQEFTNFVAESNNFNNVSLITAKRWLKRLNEWNVIEKLGHGKYLVKNENLSDYDAVE